LLRGLAFTQLIPYLERHLKTIGVLFVVFLLMNRYILRSLVINTDTMRRYKALEIYTNLPNANNRVLASPSGAEFGPPPTHESRVGLATEADVTIWKIDPRAKVNCLQLRSGLVNSPVDLQEFIRLQLEDNVA
jgi:hypothetical protein